MSEDLDKSTHRSRVIIEHRLQPSTRDEGGFIHKKTGIHYMNVAVQTDPKPKEAPPKKFTRDAQTVHMKPNVSQTSRETGTQMVLFFVEYFVFICFLFFQQKPGMAIEEAGDKILYADKQFTSDEYLALLERTALTLQRWTRGWLARKRLKEMKFVILSFTGSICESTHPDRHRKKKFEKCHKKRMSVHKKKMCSGSER